MWPGIINLLVKVAGFFFDRFKKRAEDTPARKRDEIHKAIADGDEASVNRLLDDVTSRVPSDRVRPTDGQGNPK